MGVERRVFKAQIAVRTEGKKGIGREGKERQRQLHTSAARGRSSKSGHWVRVRPGGKRTPSV